MLSIISSSSVLGDQYPAGVDPNQCPNYPFCSNNNAVTLNQIPSASQARYSFQPQSYQAPFYPKQQYNVPQPQQYQPQQYQPQQYQPRQYQPQQYQTTYNQPPQSYPAPTPINYYNPNQGRSYSSGQSTQYNTDIQKALDKGEYIGDGDYHGEGLAEALAPGYEGKVNSLEKFCEQ